MEAIASEPLTFVPGCLEAGQRCTHRGEGPVQIKLLDSGWPLACHQQFVVGPSAVASPQALQPLGEPTGFTSEACRFQQLNRCHQLVGIHEDVDIPTSAAAHQAGGLQRQCDSLKKKNRKASLFKSSGDLPDQRDQR